MAKTEKRPAKVGERILITKATMPLSQYSNGDVRMVSHVVDGGVFVRKQSLVILHREYEVIIENNENGGGQVSGIIEKMQAEINELKAKVAKLELGEVVGTLPAKSCEKTPQQVRDEIVAQAKRDISELKTGLTADGKSGYVVTRLVCDAEFIVNKEKRAVTVLLRTVNGASLKSKGIAKCAPNDCFNSHIGRAIALRRALGLEVPNEYYNAPQPTEVRVGDVVTDKRGVNTRSFTVAGWDKTVKDFSRGKPFSVKELSYGWLGVNQVKVIDDSREGITQ